MGILDDSQTCAGIANEWEPCTPELFENTDIMMFDLITDPLHKLPQNAPDGNYCPQTGLLGDLNDDDAIDILDVIIAVNIVLGQTPSNNLADINLDGIINILDIIELINIIVAPSANSINVCN